MSVQAWILPAREFATNLTKSLVLSDSWGFRTKDLVITLHTCPSQGRCLSDCYPSLLIFLQVSSPDCLSPERS